MSTFYLLPPRPVVGERVAAYLQSLLPGLSWPSSSWADLAESLSELLARQPDVYVVFGEELPAGEERPLALAHAFGAEAGDQVVEVELPPVRGQLRRDQGSEDRGSRNGTREQGPAKKSRGQLHDPRSSILDPRSSILDPRTPDP